MKLTFEELHAVADLLDRAIAHGQLQIGEGSDYDTDGLPGQWESTVSPPETHVSLCEEAMQIEIIQPTEP